MVGKHFSLFLLGGKFTALQRTLSVSGTLKAYLSLPLFSAVICLPVCLLALGLKDVTAVPSDRLIPVVLACHFVTSKWSNKLVYSRLGGQNVLYMSANRIWSVPCKQTCLYGHKHSEKMLTNV